MSKKQAEDYFDAEPARPRRRWRDCQCDGAHLGACPGPENCPNSGRMPEPPEGGEDEEDPNHVHRG